jgi:hypothetical protein
MESRAFIRWRSRIAPAGLYGRRAANVHHHSRSSAARAPPEPRWTPAQNDLGLGFAIRGGLTLALNQLFASRRTIEYHHHKGFIELGITTREHLDRALSAG